MVRIHRVTLVVPTTGQLNAGLFKSAAQAVLSFCTGSRSLSGVLEAGEIAVFALLARALGSPEVSQLHAATEIEPEAAERCLQSVIQQVPADEVGASIEDTTYRPDEYVREILNNIPEDEWRAARLNGRDNVPQLLLSFSPDRQFLVVEALMAGADPMFAARYCNSLGIYSRFQGPLQERHSPERPGLPPIRVRIEYGRN